MPSSEEIAQWGPNPHPSQPEGDAKTTSAAFTPGAGPPKPRLLRSLCRPGLPRPRLLLSLWGPGPPKPCLVLSDWGPIATRSAAFTAVVFAGPRPPRVHLLFSWRVEASQSHPYVISLCCAGSYVDWNLSEFKERVMLRSVRF